MSTKAGTKKRRNRKLITLSWMAALVIVVGVLIYKEYTAALYVLATLGVTALLIVVAMADLEHGEKTSPDGPVSS